MNDWMKGFGSKNGCHSGNPVVFEIDGITVYAGGHSRQGGYHMMEVMPDLAIGPRQVMESSSKTQVPDGFGCSNYIGGANPKYMISIDWPDFGIPQDVGIDFWTTLIHDIKRLDIKTISTQCVGGHGRTGVQLAIFAHMLGATKQVDAYSLIKWVQSQYCSHAVETAGQQQYVAEMCGLPMGESMFKPKKSNKFQFNNSPAKPKYILPIGDETTDTVEETEVVNWDGFPVSYDFNICLACDNTEWVHHDDPDLVECSECHSEQVIADEQALLDVVNICPRCDNTVSHFGMGNSGVCLLCEAEDNKLKVQDGLVKCNSCKNMVIPEFMDGKKCVHCVREHKIKQASVSKNGKKSKGKKSKGKKSKGKGSITDWI